jgi:hypothetical protein
MLPTFIIAGAPKAGTTSLWEYLKAHPQIGMASLKEPVFFSKAVGCGNRSDPLAPRFSGRYAKGPAWYEDLFRECEGAKAIGEASVPYMPEPSAPGLIKKHLPDVHLFFLLRDPVERIYSHYWQERRHGWDIPDFEKMCSDRHPAFQRYFYVSSYQLHLERYLGFFPPQQLTVLLLDDLIKDPRSFVRLVYRSLGVDSEFVPPNLGKKYNEAHLSRLPVLQRLSRYLTFSQWKISQHQHFFDFMNSPTIRYLVSLTNRKVEIPPIRPELRAALVAEMETTITYIEKYVSRDLSAWRQAAS